MEAKLCAEQEVVLVGGGNSAGQAVAFLAPKVAHLHLVVRGDGLAASMSRYLIDRIASFPNVTIHTRTEDDALAGNRESGLTAVTCRNRDTGQTLPLPAKHLFLFIGADTNSAWLGGYVAVDRQGFVLTGQEAGARDAGAQGGAVRLPLETSRHGVFAIGDVRAGSTKRVAAAVGEGAAVVAQIHAHLAR